MKVLTCIAAAIFGAFGLLGSAQADVVPRGSYQRTCWDFYNDGVTLSATCRTWRGGANFTTLRDYHNCRGDIANVNGRLTCVDQEEDDDRPPDGSYQDTCRNARVEDDTLIAECLDRGGRWRYTELAGVRSCAGDIVNANGVLRCRRDDESNDLPSGDWRASCRDARMYGTAFYAVCRDAYGKWRAVSIDLRFCPARALSNANGRLVCAGATGGYARITLYVRRYYRGSPRTFMGDVPDLNVYGLGNNVSSLVVERGAWQLCDRTYYRGRCILVTRSQQTLYEHDFNDRAESLRRVR